MHWLLSPTHLALCLWLVIGLAAWHAVRAPADAYLARLTRRRILGPLGYASLFFAAIVISGILSTILWPEPQAHDEFSYLLAADTFASGRLSNPAGPFWPHFESFHILSQPTRMSKYPPGQGLALAIGQWLTGEPLTGAWLFIAAACSALAWMLAGWLPPLWAWLGGASAALHPVILAWGQSYMGGGVALLSACLLFGAARRMRHPTVVMGAVWAAGAVGLAATRPFEGLVAVSLSTMLWLPLIREKRKSRAALGAITVLAAGALLLGVYNQAVTGDWRRLPYLAHAEQYSVAPNFVFQSPRPALSYRHKSLEQLHAGWEWSQYDSQRGWRQWSKAALGKLGTLFQEVLRLKAWLLALAFLPLAYRRWSSARFATRGALAGALAMTAVVFLNSHYVAPFVPLVFLAMTQGLRAAAHFRWRGAPWGARAVAIALAFSLVPGLALLARGQLDAKSPSSRLDASRIERELEMSGSRHLVLIPSENRGECLPNRAVIDNSPVVWARSTSEAEDARLIAHYSDRTLWRPVYRADRAWLAAEPVRLDRGNLARIE